METERLHRLVTVAPVLALAATASAFVGRSLLDDPPDRVTPELEPLAVVQARTVVSAPRAEPTSTGTGSPIDFDPLGGGVALEGGDDVPETGGLTDLIRRYFGGATVEAIVIVQCESGFDVGAYNENRDGTSDHGLFQINDVHRASFEPVTGFSWDRKYEAEPNIAFARWLWGHAGGWGPWRCNTRLEGSDFDEAPDQTPPPGEPADEAESGL